MSDALKAMIAAMGAALKAQEVVNGSANWAHETGAGEEWQLDGYFDLEQVARAGLQAVAEPTPAMLEAAADHEHGKPIAGYAVDVPALYGAMIAAILT